MLDLNDTFQVGDRVRAKLGAWQGKVGTIEEIDRKLLFSHFVRFDGVGGLWPCYRFDLEHVGTEERRAVG